jgi:carbon monoxide dehydrogenase subunit G
MLKALAIAALAIFVGVILVLALAATKPARYRIERSITIQTAPEKVFALINDLHHWPEWAPNEKDDASITRSYSGATAGPGATAQWEGKGSAGKLRLEILESSPSLVRVQADWERPFKARNMNIFTLEPQGNSTRVTWALDGENVFALKMMTVFTSTDRLMGSHFEDGLAGLKAAAEKETSQK